METGDWWRKGFIERQTTITSSVVCGLSSVVCRLSSVVCRLFVAPEISGSQFPILSFGGFGLFVPQTPCLHLTLTAWLILARFEESHLSRMSRVE